jgi:hypothetical protein
MVDETNGTFAGIIIDEETVVLGKNLFHCHCVHHKSYMN